MLFLDLGNTRVKWLVGSEMGAFGYDECKAAVAELIRRVDGPPAIVFSSVVKGTRRDSFLLCCRELGIDSLFECEVTARAAEVECGYGDVNRLGIDRWLAVVAGWRLYKSALLVVDLGTAATLDFIDDRAKHQGGYIISGLQLGIRGLLAGTSNIVVENEQLISADRQPGKTTSCAVANGAIAATAATIEVSLARHRARYPGAQLLLTGGDVVLVGPHLECHYLHRPDLLFVGMQMLHTLGLTKSLFPIGK